MSADARAIGSARSVVFRVRAPLACRGSISASAIGYRRTHPAPRRNRFAQRLCHSSVFPLSCGAAYIWQSHTHDRSRSQPFLRPRRPLRACRGQYGRSSRAHRRRAVVRAHPRSRQERDRACGGARRPQGSDHEGGPAHGHHSGCPAAGIRSRADEVAKPGAAHGLGLRQAPHGRGARPRLAEEVRKLRASSRRGCFARSGPSRPRPRRGRSCLQAAISGHAIGSRGGPASSCS